jgi:hypothetical protein
VTRRSRIAFLADEDFDDRIVSGLRSRLPNLDIVTARELGLHGKPDPQVLASASAQHRLLISHDARTLPIHASNMHVAGFSHSGVCIVPQSLAIRDAIEELVTLYECSEPDEWTDCVIRLPL